jgi:hypothetical protein
VARPLIEHPEFLEFEIANEGALSYRAAGF